MIEVPYAKDHQPMTGFRSSADVWIDHSKPAEDWKGVDVDIWRAIGCRGTTEGCRFQGTAGGDSGGHEQLTDWQGGVDFWATSH